MLSRREETTFRLQFVHFFLPSIMSATPVCPLTHTAIFQSLNAMPLIFRSKNLSVVLNLLLSFCVILQVSAPNVSTGKMK